MKWHENQIKSVAANRRRHQAKMTNQCCGSGAGAGAARGIKKQRMICCALAAQRRSRALRQRCSISWLSRAAFSAYALNAARRHNKRTANDRAQTTYQRSACASHNLAAGIALARCAAAKRRVNSVRCWHGACLRADIGRASPRCRKRLCLWSPIAGALARRAACHRARSARARRMAATRNGCAAAAAPRSAWRATRLWRDARGLVAAET